MTPQQAGQPHDDPLACSYQLDSICDEFEAKWKEGSEPSLEEFLSSVPDEHSAELFEELVHVDMHYRHALPTAQW